MEDPLEKSFQYQIFSKETFQTIHDNKIFPYHNIGIEHSFNNIISCIHAMNVEDNLEPKKFSLYQTKIEKFIEQCPQEDLYILKL